jgi:hypothetical protein
MPIELTEQQRRVVQEQAGRPVEVIDPSTQSAYVLIARDQYERVRPLLQAEPAPAAPPGPPADIPPGIRRSQEALRRALPELLRHKRLQRQWVAYHGDERIGIAPDEATLVRECLRRGLADDQYYVGWIDPSELVEVQEIESPHPEYFETPDRDDRPSPR